MNADPTSRGLWTSASAAERDRLCPGAHLASRDLPETKSPEAEAGTAIHDWLHWKRKERTPLEFDENRGIESARATLQSLLDTEPVCDYELAQRCWEMECAAVSEWEDRLPDEVKGAHELEVFSEHRFWLFLQIGRDPVNILHLQHSGQADAVYRCGNHALIVDTKTGFGDVESPAGNEQLRDLAVLIGTKFTGLEYVEVKIIQPWAKEKQPPCVYDREALQTAHRLLVNRVIASNDPKAKRIPGEVQCQFCKAKGTSRCPESLGSVMSLAVATVLNDKQELEQLPSPELLKACLLAEPIIKAVKQRARAMLKENPDAIPGYTLKENPPNKPITDPGALWARCSTLGLTLEQFMGCIKVSKGDLEEAIKQMIRLRDNVKAVKGWSSTWLKLTDGLTREEPKEPTIVRSS